MAREASRLATPRRAPYSAFFLDALGAGATTLAQYLAFQVALSKVEKDMGARRQSRAGHLGP